MQDKRRRALAARVVQQVNTGTGGGQAKTFSLAGGAAAQPLHPIGPDLLVVNQLLRASFLETLPDLLANVRVKAFFVAALRTGCLHP